MAEFLDTEVQMQSDTNLFSSDESEHATASESDMSDVLMVQHRNKKRKTLILSDLSGDEAAQKENRPKVKTHKKTKKKSSHSRKQQCSESSILLEIKDTNKLIKKLSIELKHQDSRLKEIEEKLKEAVSASSSSQCATPSPRRTRSALKREVPVEVRRETRRVYHLLLEDPENNFNGWKIEPGTTYKDPQNQSVVNILIQEVMGLNSSFLTQHIRDAAYRFYRSRNEQISAQRRGTFSLRSKSKRRHEKLARLFFSPLQASY
ncbi:uncharacterized protein LOC135342158 isoform X2 [Halichondria panicea]|uniref:uncharacterized protein LOC135342158 isoform X2 n=1 Tax=Halichondria panicea TaxID=6063 RepID=UPI00312B4B76